jgi:uncharacterized small protein (TIGR04563 family)
MKMASTSSQKKKVTLYFNAGMLQETQKEALRQDRSVSWIIQAAWRIAREEIRQTPGVLPGPSGKASLPEGLDDSTTPPPLVAPRPVSRV